MKTLSLDPNLLKFISAHEEDIKNGKTYQVITQVKDYLFQVTSPTKASKELSQFISYVKKLANA